MKRPKILEEIKTQGRGFISTKEKGDLFRYINFLESKQNKLPTELTAENGAKALLNGEFHEDFDYYIDGLGHTSAEVPVSWTTIKEIYSKIVNHYNK